MWRKLNINKQNIKADNEKSVLFACPHNSKLNGFEFWFPAKLVRNGNHSNAVSISYTDDFIFHLKKYGKGKYNKYEIVEELDVGCEEIEMAFGSMNVFVDKFETHKPRKLKAEKVKVLEELKDE